MIVSGSFFRDANYVPITVDGVVSQKSQTLSGSNATVATPLFRITGSIEVRAIWGVITTDLGANNTAAFYRANDQTAQPAITLATGTTLSAKKAGSVIAKTGLAGAAVVLLDNAAGVVSEPSVINQPFFTPFVITKKTAANTDIEFVYTTTDTPTSGVIQHFIRWLPISADANVVVQ